MTINDVDYGYLGRFNIEGEWVEITSETEVKGYVFDGFLEKSNGIWDLNTIIGTGIIWRKEKLIDLTEGNNNWSEIVVANIYSLLLKRNMEQLHCRPMEKLSSSFHTKKNCPL